MPPLAPSFDCTAATTATTAAAATLYLSRLGSLCLLLHRIIELHDRKISHVDVHPTRDWSIVTASNDCTVKLWDARKLGKSSDALASFAHGRAATSAIFSPIDGNRLLTTSYDDLVRVIELPNDGGAGKITVDDGMVTKLRHDNQTGRWLTNFRATWDPKSDST